MITKFLCYSLKLMDLNQFYYYLLILLLLLLLSFSYFKYNNNLFQHFILCAYISCPLKIKFFDFYLRFFTNFVF